MFILNARFAALLIFCGIAINPLSTPGSTGVHAAVINRGAQRNSGHPVRPGAENLDDKQTHFSSPWSHKARRSSLQHKHRQTIESRSKHSIVVPSDEGKKYVVSHSRRAATTPQWVAAPGNQTSFNSTAVGGPERLENDLLGVVELMSKDSKPIAYLAEGQFEGSQVLEATGSKTEASKMSLSNAPAMPNGPPTREGKITVNLCKQDEIPRKCATFDPDTLYDQPIQLEPQFNNPADSKKSQLFSYDRKTGELSPVSYSRNTNGSSNSTAGAAELHSTSSIASSMPQSSTTSMRRRDEFSSSSTAMQTQNVTLVFVPQSSNNTRAFEIKEHPSASTVTETVTVYSSAYPRPSGAGIAAISVTPSSSGAIASSVPSGHVSGMNVELVGNAVSSPVQSSSPSSASSSGFVKAAATGPIQARSSSASVVFGVASVTVSPSASASFDAAAIAASLATSYRSAASYSASNVASPSSSGSAFVAASASASASARADGQPAFQSVLAAAAWRRAPAPAMETVKTDPYTWQFSSESK